MSANTDFRCDDVERLWAAYLDHTIDPADADAIEAHAAECVACETRVNRVGASMVMRARAFAPEVPAALRETTLRAVSVVPRPRARRWWRTGLGVAAVAAATLVIVRQTPVPTARVTDSAVAPVPTGDADAFQTAALRSAAHLADEQARSEFRALDDAMAELELALKQAPADASLRAYVSAVRARRAELARRVKDATS